MRCKGKICKNAVFSQSVTLTDGTVIINVPQRSFNAGENICLFVIQNIPADAPINAPVVVTIGTEATQYNLVNCSCAQVTACAIRTRRRYPVRIVGTLNSAVFKVLSNLSCTPDNTIQVIPAPTPATPAGGNV